MDDGGFGDLGVRRSKNFFDELNSMLSIPSLEARGENAFGVACKFIQLLEKHITDEEECRKLIMSWFKAVRDRDYRKFRRALNRYKKKE